MIQDHCGATDYAGLVAVGGRQKQDFAGSQGDRVAVYALAQSCYEYVVGLGHVAGDDQCFGVEQVDGTGEYLADMAPTPGPESGLSEAVSSPLTSISASLLAETVFG